jgi:hypothetical protein
MDPETTPQDAQMAPEPVLDIQAPDDQMLLGEDANKSICTSDTSSYHDTSIKDEETKD